jgi:hypothetical protein
VLDDLRQSLEAEIAARKLVEAKLTVAEAECARLRQARDSAVVSLAACGVAAMQNTQETRRERIASTHSAWSASYGAVCRAVDREIAARERANRAEAALARVREVPDRWMCKQGKYPVDSDSRVAAAAAAIRLCAKELRAALAPDAPEPPKGDPR